jgi:hypothetical protein
MSVASIRKFGRFADVAASVMFIAASLTLAAAFIGA